MERTFLPPIDNESPTVAPVAGEGAWSHFQGGVVSLANLSASLVVPQTSTPAERIKSVPNPWARVLLFEQALFDERHPAHGQVAQEWRGMLGAIGLSTYLGLNVGASYADLGGGGDVMESLLDMAPSGERERWGRVGLITISGALVGGTSPRTIVFSGIRASVPQVVPFQEAGRLIDPVRHYKRIQDTEALGVLQDWIGTLLDNLNQSDLHEYLGSMPASAGAHALSRASLILERVEAWKGEVESATGSGAAVTVDYGPSPLRSLFPDGHPASPVLGAVTPVRVSSVGGAVPQNDLRLKGRDKVINPGRQGVIYRDEQRYTGPVRLPNGHTRQAVNGRFDNVPSAENLGDPSAPDLGSFIQPKLVRVVDVNEQNASSLSIAGNDLLYPFGRDVLDHLDPQEVAKWTSISGDPTVSMTVMLSVPLRQGLSVEYRRDYAPHDIVDESSPEVAVWPDFETAEWDHYFYFVSHPAAEGGLEVDPVVAVEEEYAPVGGQRVRWGRSARPVHTWEASAGGAKGLLLSQPAPRPTQTGETWAVSIDFGSTHTRVFRKRVGVTGASRAEPITIKPRARVLLGELGGLGLLFFDKDGEGVEREEPLSLIRFPLTRPVVAAAGWLPSAGVMYHDESLELPELIGLRSNLKWHGSDDSDQKAFHSYTAHLYLSVAAEAAAAGARVGSVVTAYPSVFPEYLRYRHEQEWGRLEDAYGVDVKPPVAESTALASFLAHELNVPIQANLLAVDVGGSTSDLTVWAGGQQRASDSVRMAGGLISQLVATDEAAREAVRAAAAHAPIEQKALPFSDEGSDRDILLFNALLRYVTSKTGSALPLAKLLYPHPGAPGEQIIAHVGYLFAALSYMLGMMARRASLETDRYDVRFGGRGSSYLEWLGVYGSNAPQELCTTFFLAGLGGEGRQAKVEVRSTGADAKTEVGRGLLVALDDAETAPERVTFIGEGGYVTENGDEVEWSAPLSVANLEKLRKPTELSTTPPHLSRFIRTFEDSTVGQRVSKALGIEPGVLDMELRDKILTSLFGPSSAFAQASAQRQSDYALLEPFFIVEAKALLQHATGNNHLFAP